MRFGHNFAGVGEADFAVEGDDPEIAMPSYRTLVRKGFTPSALLRMQEASGNLVSSGNNADSGLTVGATPTYRYMVGGLRGAYIDTDADKFTANVYDPANSSAMEAFVFSVAASGAQRFIGGRYDLSTGIGLYVQILADSTLRITASDVAPVTKTTVHPAISFGSTAIYMLGVQIDRSGTPALRTRLSKLGAGLVGAQQSTALATLGTITGGAAPLFNFGGHASFEWGSGIWHGGFAYMTGAQSEGASAPGNFAVAAGFE